MIALEFLTILGEKVVSICQSFILSAWGPLGKRVLKVTFIGVLLFFFFCLLARAKYVSMAQSGVGDEVRCCNFTSGRNTYIVNKSMKIHNEVHVAVQTFAVNLNRNNCC